MNFLNRWKKYEINTLYKNIVKYKLVQNHSQFFYIKTFFLIP